MAGKIQSGDLVWAQRNSPSTDDGGKWILANVEWRKLHTVRLRPLDGGRRWSTEAKKASPLTGSTRWTDGVGQ